MMMVVRDLKRGSYAHVKMDGSILSERLPLHDRDLIYFFIKSVFGTPSILTRLLHTSNFVSSATETKTRH